MRPTSGPAGLLPAPARRPPPSKSPLFSLRSLILLVSLIAALYLAATALGGPSRFPLFPFSASPPARARLPFAFSRPVVPPPPDAPGARPRVLVTGGAGFIGSHTVVELVAAGFAVTILDNLINSSPESVARVRRLVDAPEAIAFARGDVRDEAALGGALSSAPHVAIIHFAALKAVGESISKPLDYYENNLGGLTSVLAAAAAFGVKQVVFSSSATVYGNAEPPFTEATPVGVGITNPYGQTKYIAEIVLRDFTAANPATAVACLRYFNPVGAHLSGTIGEDPQGIPNNIMPLCVGPVRRPCRPPFLQPCPLLTPSPPPFPPSPAPTHAACSAWPRASTPSSPSTATTTPRPTAPRSATTSTWWTSQRGTSRRCSGWRSAWRAAWAAWRWLTWAPAPPCPSWSS